MMKFLCQTLIKNSFNQYRKLLTGKRYIFKGKGKETYLQKMFEINLAVPTCNYLFNCIKYTERSLKLLVILDHLRNSV